MAEEKTLFVPIDQVNISAERFENLDGSHSRKTINLESEESFIVSVPETIATEVVSNNIIGESENLVKRKQMLNRLNQEPLDFAYERAIGNNDSVYSNFVELILEAKKKVGRIVIKQGADNVGFATGFMVSPSLLLTNWHVFKSKESVNDSVVQFFYELDSKGNPSKDTNTFLLDPEAFYFAHKDLDYCLISVKKMDISNSKNLSEIGFIRLDPTLGKLGNEDQEKLNIIHHPKGDYKQLSIRENTFTQIQPTTIWYESDTSQGSSGSPVFNDQWQLVALHHMGVPKKDTDGNYLDKDNKIIPVVNRQIDVNRIHWIANEGVRISVIVKHIKLEFPNSPIIIELLSQSNIPTTSENLPNPNSLTPSSISNIANYNPENINISIPTSSIKELGNIIINISSSTQLQNNPTFSPALPASHKNNELALFEESLKLEQAADYSECDGYLSNFLGSDFRITLPKPKAEIKNFLTKLNGKSSSVLKYHKYSVIMHNVRKMPILSAINVDGNSELRLDNTEREDVWIRDNRIDLDSQLNQQYYAKSGFDRGHMSRREDANWGATAEEAKRNADFTCIYTNACPQVPTINRSNKSGLWGKLEKLVLEKGAIKENGKTGKISVFSGPIFKNNDSVYKGIQVPMEFFKVIAWISDTNKLKVTAFKLSQQDLVGDINFEDLAIDDNIEFKEYQCSLKYLEEATSINFSNLIQFDTFQNDEEVAEVTESLFIESL